MSTPLHMGEFFRQQCHARRAWLASHDARDMEQHIRESAADQSPWTLEDGKPCKKVWSRNVTLQDVLSILCAYDPDDLEQTLRGYLRADWKNPDVLGLYVSLAAQALALLDFLEPAALCIWPDMTDAQVQALHFFCHSKRKRLSRLGTYLFTFDPIPYG